MTIFVMVGYYLFAFAAIFSVAYLTHRQNSRELRHQVDAAIARMQAQMASTPPLVPYVPALPLNDVPDAEDEYADTIASVREQLAELADHGYPVTAALEEVTALARRVGVS